MVVGEVILKMAADVASLVRDFNKVKSSLSEVERAFGQARTAALGFFGLQMAKDMVIGLAQVADGALNVAGRLKIATASSQEFLEAQKEIYRISQNNKTSLTDTAMLYTRMAEPIRRMGGTAKETVGVTEALSAALRISGARAAESSSAILQFSQAMGSGVLRGEEFNAVNEASPRLMKALADGLGVAQGALKDMAAQGQLTADIVANALLKNLAQLQAEAQAMPLTIGGAFQEVKNAFTLFLQEVENGTGVFNGFAEILQLIGAWLSLFTEAMKTLGSESATTADQLDGVKIVFAVIGTVVETVVVLISEFWHILKSVGTEAGGIAAQIAAVLRGDFAQVKSIREEMIADSEKSAAAQEKFTRTVANFTSRVLEQRDALKSGKLSQSEYLAENQRLMRGVDGSVNAFKTLKTQVEDAAAAKAKAKEAAKALSEEQKREMKVLKERQKLAEEARKEAERLAKEEAKTRAEVARDLQKAWEEERKQTDQIREGNARLQEKIDLLTLTEDAILQKNIAQIQDQIEEKEAALALEEGNAELEEQIRLLRERIKLMQNLDSAEAEEKNRKALEKSTEKLQEQMQRASDQMGQALADALLNGGMSAGEAIEKLFKTMVLKPVVEAVVQPFAGALSGLLQQFLGTLTGVQGAAGGANNLASLASGAGSLYNMLSAGSSGGLLGSAGTAIFGSNAAYGAAIGTTNIAAGSQAAMLAAQTGEFGLAGASMTSSAAAGAGAGASSMMSSVMAFAPYAALIAAGMMASSKLYDKGFSDKSDDGGLFSTVGMLPAKFDTMILKALGINSKTANILTGAPVIAKLFGRAAPRADGQALVGSFGGGDFTGSVETSMLAKGGWFRSDKRWTETSAVNGELAAGLDKNAAALLEQAKRYGQVLGLPVQSLADVQAQFRIQLGQDEKANQEAIAKALGGYSDALLGTFSTQLAPVQREGETTAQTIERLSASLIGANNALAGLNVTMFNTSVAGADAASKLVGLFGGLENLGAATANYYGRYYNEAEKAAKVTAQVTTALADAGLAMPATRAAFRALVEAQDLTTDSGRKAFATLMGVAGAFDELSGYREAELQKAIEMERELARVRAENAQALRDAIDGILPRVLTPAQLENHRYARASDQLAGLGLNFDPATLKGASAQSIIDFAQSFVLAAENSDQAKTALLGIVGSLLDLKDAAADLVRQNAIKGVEGQLKNLRDTIGDTSVVDSFETVSAAFVRNRSELEQLETGLSRLLGTTVQSAQEALAELLQTQKALDSYRSGTLGSAITDARLRSLDPGARVSELRRMEGDLFGQLATSADPVATAQRLQAVVIQRIKEEAALRTKDAQAAGALAQSARDAQIKALREQITGAERLHKLAQDMAQLTGTLRFGDLSPLAFDQQLGAAKTLFERTLAQAQAGDAAAQGQLGGNAQAYLEEARSFYASSPEYAAIFSSVTGALDSLGMGDAGAQTELTVLQQQLAALEDMKTAQTEEQNTAGEELAALLQIDTALAQRSADMQTAIDKQTAAAREQIEALRDIVNEQRAQIVQAAEATKRLETQLEELNDTSKRTYNLTVLEAERPVERAL